MKKIRIQATLILALLTLGHFVSAAESKSDTTGLRSALRQVNEAYGKAFIKGDSSIFINCYATDAAIMPENSRVISGVKGQLAFFKFAYKSGVRNIVFKTVDLFGPTEQFVTEQGEYEMFGTDNNSLGKGKYLVFWKKVGKEWKMYRDMFSSNGPPPVKK